MNDLTDHSHNLYLNNVSQASEYKFITPQTATQHRYINIMSINHENLAQDSDLFVNRWHFEKIEKLSPNHHQIFLYMSSEHPFLHVYETLSCTMV